MCVCVPMRVWVLAYKKVGGGNLRKTHGRLSFTTTAMLMSSLLMLFQLIESVSM